MSSEKTIRYESFNTADGIKVAGHANSLWGLLWSPSDLSDANFRAKVRLAGRESTGVDDLAIDHISVKVFHEATSGGSTATTTSYMHLDHLGGTNAVTDENGELAQTLDYYPFGSPRIKTGADVSEREYIGEHFDEETNLSYLNARYYEGSRGQFLGQDRVFLSMGDRNTGESDEVYKRNLLVTLSDPQRLNSYSYALNNPMRNIDPSGEASTEAYLLSPILTALQVVLGKLSIAIYQASNSNTPLTAQLFSRSLNLNPPNVRAGNGSLLSDQIKNSPEYRGFVGSVIEEAEKESKAHFVNEYYGDAPGSAGNSIAFEKGDLSTAIGGTLRTVVAGRKDEKGKWNLSVSIHDIYNFQYKGKKDYKDRLGLTTVNNAALIPQGTGALSNYGIDIYFSDTR